MTDLVINYMKTFPDRFIFTEDDRISCFGIIDFMLKLVSRASAVKPMNLEEEVFQTDDFFLKKALILYVDNVGRAAFREIMSTYIVSEGCKGKELLNKLIILEGMSAIYNTEGQGLVEERLKAYLGEKYAAEYENRNESNKLKTGGDETTVVETAGWTEASVLSRKKVQITPSASNVILSQQEIDVLVKKLLG